MAGGFSVGQAITDRERAAIAAIPKRVWADAVDADGDHRDGAGLAEITRLLPTTSLQGYPDGTRVIVGRERPRPGVQLDLMGTRDGWRYICFATDTRTGQLTLLDARHHAHARVEDRIRTAKETGLDHLLSRTFAINQAWLRHITEVNGGPGSEFNGPEPGRVTSPPRSHACTPYPFPPTESPPARPDTTTTPAADPRDQLRRW